MNTKLHKRAHQCGEQFCRTCKNYVSDEHQCYMQPASVNDVKKRNTNGLTADDGKQNEEDIKTFIFFDFECTQDD